MSHYIIVFNNLERFDSNEIHKVVTNISTITDWWHYLPNVYIVSTTGTSKYIADKIITAFKGLSFLVIKLDIRDYNGVLNKDAWEWLRKKNNQTLRLKVIPSPLSSNPLLRGLLPPITQTSPTPTALDILSDLLNLKRK